MAPAGDAAQGDLFQGMTFWLSQKVPLRKEAIKRITENGGLIVKQDKDAEFIIADPKQDIQGSYAPAFVHDAIREKRLPNKDDYLNKPPPSATQPAGNNAKATRTPFTNDDDAELIAWVLSNANRFEGKIKGNELYHELGIKNNRHTAQSWRDRFVKKYSDRPIEQLQAMASRYTQGPAQPAQNLPPVPLPALPGRSTPSSTNRQRPAVKKRNPFTREEDEALLGALQDLPSDTKIMEWFEAYAKEHPTHTGVAWYHHYSKFIKPNLLEGAGTSRVQPSPRRDADSSPVDRRKQPTSTPAKPPAPRDNLPGNRKASRKEAAVDPERKNFFDNLRTFFVSRGRLNHNADFEPTIEGHVVDLHQLYKLVDESELEPNELSADLWAEIATRLGLDCNNRKSVPLKTKKLWDVYLDDFYESLLEPEEGSQDEEAEDDPDEDAELPPHTSLGRKRSLEPEPELPSKRVRRSRDEEIASTPVSRVRRGEKPVSSPSLAAATPSGHSQHHPSAPVDEDDDDNVTPSQQLHNEEAEVTPIPIQLEGPSSRRRSNIPRPAPDNPIASREASEPPAQDDGMAELASQCERFEALGYSADDIKTALRATTFDIGLAGYVMEHYLKQKKKLPKNMEGVWTKGDDDGLRFVDGLPSRMGAADGEDEEANRQRRKAEWNRLVDKHTQERIESRRDYQALAGEL